MSKSYIGLETETRPLFYFGQDCLAYLEEKEEGRNPNKCSYGAEMVYLQLFQYTNALQLFNVII